LKQTRDISQRGIFKEQDSSRRNALSMIDPKAAKKLILSSIAELASIDGFIARINDQVFHLVKPFGLYILHVSFIPHGKTDLDLTVDIAVRVHAVERLVNEIRPDLSPSNAEKTATLGGDIGNIHEGRQKRWTITSLDELPRVIPTIYSEVRAVAWPFFERYSNMRNLLAVLSSLSSNDWRLAPGHLARCRRAIALAFLVGSADGIAAVTNACEILLAEKDLLALSEWREFTVNIRAKQSLGQLPKLEEIVSI
jgi:hypothetical protein